MLLGLSKNYQHNFFVLKNKLKVCVLQNKNLKKSAASLCINTGHYADPNSTLGLSHLLEHMLFLGSLKYPNENFFQNLIKSNNGYVNAWTSNEKTVFYYDVNNQAFYKTLDVFSDFFKNPLFKKKLIKNEIKIIDAEFQSKINDDFRKKNQILKELCNTKHPFSRFSSGNFETLGKQETQLLKERLFNYFKQHYYASNMTLVIVSPNNYQTVKNYIVELFSDIKNPNHEKIVKFKSPNIFTQNSTQNLIKLKSESKNGNICLSFIIPKKKKYSKTKPLTYISHIIGSEEKGTLHNYLKKNNYINSLVITSGMKDQKYQELSIIFVATKYGMDNVNLIVKLFFEYIYLIKSKGIEKWRFKEKSQMLQNLINHKEDYLPIDLARETSINMHLYPKKKTFFGDYEMSNYDKKILLINLGFLSPKNLNIFIFSNLTTFKLESLYYQTPYSKQKISQKELNSWEINQENTNLQLPKPNPFITYQKSSVKKSIKKKKVSFIKLNEKTNVWVKNPSKDNRQKGYLFVSLNSNILKLSLQNNIISKIFTEILLYQLEESTYQTEVAGIHIDIFNHAKGITVQTSGFQKFQPELLERVLAKIINFKVSKKDFIKIKSQLKHNYKQALNQKPLNIFLNYLAGIIQPNYPTYYSFIKKIDQIEFDDIINFKNLFLESVSFDFLFYGNWNNQKCKTLTKLLTEKFPKKNTINTNKIKDIKNILYPKETLSMEIKLKTKESCVLVYYQAPKFSYSNIAFYSFAHYLISTEFYNEIRTKQQLGYLIGTSYITIAQHPGIIFYIQSSLAGSKEILNSIDQFIKDFILLLVSIESSTWEKSKKNILKQLTKNNQNTSEKANRIWNSISHGDYSFTQRKKICAEIESLDRVKTISFFSNFLKPTNSARVVLFHQSSLHKNKLNHE